jgi:ribose 5-phosphate isomerase A
MSRKEPSSPREDETSARRVESLSKIAKAISAELKAGSLCGLGSGTTVASLLVMLSQDVKKRGLDGLRWVPTSLQILLAAQELGFEMTAMDRPSLELVLDGADQIDGDLNLIKGGGGALFKEKVLISCARKTVIVADERKYVDRLCSSGVRVPVEASPFARVPVAERLRALGGEPVLRLGERGFPFYTENGNLIFDVLFGPIERAVVLEREIKAIAGVVESGIFTKTPIEVYLIKEDGTYVLHQRSAAQKTNL